MDCATLIFSVGYEHWAWTTYVQDYQTTAARQYSMSECIF